MSCKKSSCRGNNNQLVKVWMLTGVSYVSIDDVSVLSNEYSVTDKATGYVPVRRLSIKGQ